MGQEKVTISNSPNWYHQKNDSTVRERKSTAIVTKHTSLIRSFIHFVLFEWHSEPGTMVDHGDIFHCAVSAHLTFTGVQSNEQSIIILQVTRMSLYWKVSAAPQLRGESHRVWCRGSEPIREGFLVRSHTSSGSSVTIPLASDQEDHKGTSCGARNRPKQGWLKNPMLIICTPPEQYSLNMFYNFILKWVSTAGEDWRSGAQGSLLLTSMVPNNPAPAPNLQALLSKIEALSFPKSPFSQSNLITCLLLLKHVP